jgi:hypothetical protein
MSTISNAPLPGGMHRPSGDRLWCPECQTDEHLIVESIEALHPPQEGLVDVSYTCVECDYFYAHAASVHDVAAVLNRHGQVMGVLQFGGEYLHCGTPMISVSSGTSSISGHELSRRHTIHDVHLPTRVLRCGCGFQMEVPD